MKVKVLFLVHSSACRIVILETLLVHSLSLCQSCTVSVVSYYICVCVCVCEWCILYQSWPLLAGAPCVCVSHTLSLLSCYSTEAESCWQTLRGKGEGCVCDVCVCVRGQRGRERRRGNSERSGKTKGRRLVWRRSLPYRVTLSTWCDLSHMGGWEDALLQTDGHTHTHRHTNKLTETHICLRLLDSSLQHFKQFITHHPL